MDAGLTFTNAQHLLPAADEAQHRSRNGDMYIASLLAVIEADQAELVQARHGDRYLDFDRMLYAAHGTMVEMAFSNNPLGVLV